MLCTVQDTARPLRSPAVPRRSSRQLAGAALLALTATQSCRSPGSSGTHRHTELQLSWRSPPYALRSLTPFYFTFQRLLTFGVRDAGEHPRPHLPPVSSLHRPGGARLEGETRTNVRQRETLFALLETRNKEERKLGTGRDGETGQAVRAEDEA
jgi:hypothetical protein